MTYQILDYSMNEPSTKRITVPLRSSYGLGIRVSENGQALSVDPNQIAVNGISATTKMFDVHLCDLSSGTAPCQKEYDVTVNGQPAPTQINARQVSFENESDEYEQGTPLPMYFFPQLQLPIDIEAGPNATGKIKVTADGETFEDTIPIFVTISNDDGFKTYVAPNGDFWEEVDTQIQIGNVLTVPAGSEVSFNMQYDLPPRSSGTADYTLTIESDRNAPDAKFKLVVNESDLGYFEI